MTSTSYVELSPSGHGLRIIATGAEGLGKPPGWRIDAEPAAEGKVPRAEGAGTKFFFTLTGHHVEGTPTTMEHRPQAWGRYKAFCEGREAPLDPHVAEINRDHAVVHTGGDVVIAREYVDASSGHRTVSFLRPEKAKLWYANSFITVQTAEGPKRKALWPHWLSHSQRRQYDGVTFEPVAPGEQPHTGRAYNLFTGWAVEPDPRGKDGCPLFLNHLLEVVGGDETHYNWLIAWLADAVQHPAVRPGTGVILQAGQGAGKSIIGQYLGAMYGGAYVYIGNRNQLAGKFNKLFQAKLLIVGDEVVFARDHAAANYLKSLVTEDVMTVEPKGIELVPGAELPAVHPLHE